MSEELKIPRLGKAAREFNISTHTIVEFLSKKGFSIEDSINTKLTIEMYDLLTVEYQSEKHIKEEAQRLEIASLKSSSAAAFAKDKEVVPEKEIIKIVDTEPAPSNIERTKPTETDNKSIEKVKQKEKSSKQKAEGNKQQAESKKQKVESKKQEPQEQQKTIIEQKEKQQEKIIEQEEKQEEKIEDSFHHQQEEKKEEEVEKEEKEEPKEEDDEDSVFLIPKIVGKIDLNTINEKRKSKKKSRKEKEREAAALKKEKEKKKEEREKINKEIEEKLKKKEESKKKKAEDKKKKAENEKEKAEVKEKQEKEATLPKKKEPEMIKADVPNIKAPTVVGKIDLSSINTKTKPKKKSHAQLIREKEERLRLEQQQREALRDARRAARKVALDAKYAEEKEKRKKYAKTKDAKQNNTTGRTQGGKVGNKFDPSSPKKEIGKETGQKPAGQGQGQEDAANKKRKRIKTFKDREFPKDFQSRDSYRRGERGDFQREKRTEITTEAIDSQIKRTMARMAPVGKTKASKHRREKRDLIHQEFEQAQERQAQEKNILKVTEFITVNDIANMMNVPVGKIIATCMSVGLVVSINQRLDAENIALVAEEYGYTVQFAGIEDEEDKQEDLSNPEDLVPRAPIVTVMGHVDHGKTSLLDYIRKTNVIAGEAGGITQHIGSYEVELSDKRKITFLDTPGHEAFTAMRARGAKVTDIVIIMIAADDAIMPQTVEAINHAQAAGVPMIFAINKIDKPGADPEKIRNTLANMNLLVEEWGGKIQSQDIAAKKGINVDVLLEKVLIEAEMLELKANPKLPATGTVIESSLDKGRGYIAKMLIQNGTLNKGDIIVAGKSYGKIKAMYNERNQLITSAGPASPVLLLGLDSAPQAGDTFRIYAEEREAKSVVSKRQQLIREQGLRTQKHITLTEIGRRIAVGDFKELNIIVKGDVDGSIEALSDSLLRLSTESVEVKIIHKSVGQVTESDVLLASASNAIIVAFQVRPSDSARKLAEQEQIDIRTYSIIYDAINELKDAIEGMKAPEIKENIVCNIEVRETFRISKIGVIAGCYVLDGKVQRSTKIRVIRDGIVIHTGRLGSLKRFKDDVKEVTAGYECGLNIESFNDIKTGDIIEGFEEVEVRK
jgi:translation initiation factor IF-2